MKKALIVYGGWPGHDPEGLKEVFSDVLTKENFDVTASDSLDAFLGDLGGLDLIVPVWTMGSLTSEQEKNVCAAVAKGTGLAGCHGGMCDAFRNNVLWQFMTGSQWVAHPGNGGVTYRVRMKRASSSPLIDGIGDFDVTSEQYYLHVDPAVEVLAVTDFAIDNGDHFSNGIVTMPVVYTKMWGKGRVYYNSLGHNRKIFDIPEAREMMRRGFLFAAR